MSDFERHSPEVWRKTADSLRETAGQAADVLSDSEGRGVNRNGAPLLGDTRDLFRPKTSDIPAQPGVYKWRDGEGRVIYVGKAKNLRNRLTNYFQPLYQLHPRTQTMVLTARSLEWTVVGTELESLTLEYTWIKEFDPRFNVVFRDDKTYPYLAISSGERVPRIWVTRSRKRRDTRYFGPYAKVWDLRHSLDRLLKTFPVRTCSQNVFHKAEITHRPCLLASIGKCSAPCVGRIGAEEHRRMCEQLVGVLTGRIGKSYIAQLTREMKLASDELEFEKAARLRDRASLAEADSDSLKATIAEAKAAVDSASSALEKAKSAATDIKVDLGRIEVQVENALKAITADGYVLEDALALPEPEDRDAMEREVEKLRRQIASIGPVNEVAMDEYLRLKERSDYIATQVADLESARKAVTKITAAIERKMRRQFLVIFDQVNANFTDVFGVLFPGGHAHLEMTDPDHLDETGIEIVAQPRGKKLQKMMLMSGGEKSLTALALLFAVYRTRTVPFYIFDEVEAALDDSNLGKLLDAIEALKETTQLIVISHQRRTMEQADVLYGVSMQADGVSHVVSQRLDRTTGKVVEA